MVRFWLCSKGFFKETVHGILPALAVHIGNSLGDFVLEATVGAGRKCAVFIVGCDRVLIATWAYS